MTGVVVDTSKHTSVARIDAVGVRSDAVGPRMERQPAFFRRAAAVHKPLADATAHRRGAGVTAGWGGPRRAGQWERAPVHSFVRRGISTAGGQGAGRVTGWSALLRRWGGRGGGLRGSVVTLPRAGARRRGRGRRRFCHRAYLATSTRFRRDTVWYLIGIAVYNVECQIGGCGDTIILLRWQVPPPQQRESSSHGQVQARFSL